MSIQEEISMKQIVYEFMKNSLENVNSTSSKRFIYSWLSLTDLQKQNINELNKNYSSFYNSNDVYVMIQQDNYDENNNLTETFQFLISFVEVENNNYIYGLYYIINNQNRFSSSELAKSNNRISLSNSATFTSIERVEVYYKIFDLIVAQVLSLINDVEPVSELHYRNNCIKYILTTNNDINVIVNNLCNTSCNIIDLYNTI